jgi:hypothetical protein
MQSRPFNYHAAYPERRLFARVSHVEKVGEGPRGRTSFEFDGIDFDSVGSNFEELANSSDTKPFALLRIVTTVRRFASLFSKIPEEGDWFALTLVPREQAKKLGRRKLLSWHAQLSVFGYLDQSRGYTSSIEFLFKDGEPALKSLGAAATTSSLDLKDFADAVEFPSEAIVTKGTLRRYLNYISRPTSVLVRDVGQASFISLLNNKAEPLLHYDAGWPISFNGKTVRAGKQIECGDAPVILSHWDWDHLHGYYRYPILQKRMWIAPIQKMGLGAKRIVVRLNSAKKLMGYGGAPIQLPWGQLALCTGPRGNNNQTGIALRVCLVDREQALLIGDADYNQAPASLRRTPLDALVVTHHGAEFSGSVPIPRAVGDPCIVSVGKYNVYKHPRVTAIRKHKARKWAPIATAALWQARRGDRQFP